jgi:hypothetical protein
VTVLKHFDKLREKLLANNEAAIFCIVFFISTQGIINAVLLATRSGASKTDIFDRQIHN